MTPPCPGSLDEALPWADLWRYSLPSVRYFLSSANKSGTIDNDYTQPHK
jgi:hypothetical protein